MKKIIILFTLVTSLMTCTAQTYPLNTFYKDIPDYAYKKDLDNVLSPYVGIYKATYEGNETTLYITKEDKMLIDYGVGDRKFYKDVLHQIYRKKAFNRSYTSRYL